MCLGDTCKVATRYIYINNGKKSIRLASDLRYLLSTSDLSILECPKRIRYFRFESALRALSSLSHDQPK